MRCSRRGATAPTAAQLLGIGRTTLYRKLKEYQLGLSDAESSCTRLQSQVCGSRSMPPTVLATSSRASASTRGRF